MPPRLLYRVALACCLMLAAPAFGQQKPGRVTVVSVTLEPGSVVGGAPVTGRVALSGPAPLGGFQIALTSSNPSAATVPAQVAVKPGLTAAAFTITTHPTGAQPSVVPPPLAVTITAVSAWTDPATRRVEQTTQTATLTVLPPLVSGVGFPSHALCARSGGQAGGTPVNGCVVLTGPAPGFKGSPAPLPGTGAGGAAVGLSSNNAAVVSVPTSVTVHAGQTRAEFAITTKPVAVDTPVVISAQRGPSDSHSATLTVQAPRLMDFVLSPSTVQGGGQVQGTVKLTGPVAAGAQVVVDLRATGAGASAVSMPTSLIVPAGADGGRIDIRTQPVTSPTSVTIGAAYGGATKTVTLTINPAPVIALASITCNPTTIAGGNPVSCRVSLTNPAPSGGAQVNLSSSRPEVAPVPASVTVAAGGTSSSPFTVTTNSVTSSTAVTLSASYGGSTKTTTLTVNPVIPADLAITVYSLTGIAGEPLPDTRNSFYLNATIFNATGVGAAPASTFRVQLTSNPAQGGYPKTRTTTTPSLAPGASAPIKIMLEGFAPNYTYTFTMCADATSLVPETNENNNCTTFSITQH